MQSRNQVANILPNERSENLPSKCNERLPIEQGASLVSRANVSPTSSASISPVSKANTSPTNVVSIFPIFTKTITIKASLKYDLTARSLALSVPENIELLEKLFSARVIDWHQFTAIANNHLVLQMMYPELMRYKLLDYLPTELQSHIKKVYNLNTDRNHKILGQISDISDLLFKNNIKAIFLKGAGILLDDSYQDNGCRIMEDIDILTSQKDWQKTVQLIISNGYSPRFIPDESYLSKRKHYPRLSKASEPAEIEIHQTAVKARYAKKLSFDLLYKNAIPSKINHQAFVLNDTYKIIHSALHTMIEHKGFKTAHIRFREMKEIEMLSKKVNLKEITNLYPWFHKEIISLLKLTESVFHLPHNKNLQPSLSTSFFLYRHRLNLNNNIFLFLTLILLIYPKKVYIHYIKVPVLAIFSKKERHRFLLKIFKAKTWRRHFRSYGKLLGG